MANKFDKCLTQGRGGRWAPLAFFLIVPVGLLSLAYWLRSWATLLGLSLLGVLILFAAFLARYRRTEVAASGSVIPTALGPFLAALALKGADSSLVPLLDSGGSFLIELAFYFSGLVGLGVYVWVRVASSSLDPWEHRTGVIGFSALLILFFLPVFFSASFFSPPTTAGPSFILGIHYPSPSLLLACRVVLVLANVGFVCVPRNGHS